MNVIRKTLMNHRVIVAILFCWTAISTPLAAQEEAPSRRAEAIGIVRPNGVPQQSHLDEAQAKALRQIIEAWIKSESLSPAQQRSASSALKGLALPKLQEFFDLVEIVSTKQRTGYCEVKVAGQLKFESLRRWWTEVEAQADNPVKKLKIMVVIPEYHIARVIPDPAGETEVIRNLLSEDFRLIDQKQVETIRSKDLVKRAAAGDPKELLAIAQGFGADLLLVGEAFSQDVAPDPLISGGLPTCSARIEARIIRCDTGEIVAADDGQGRAVDHSPAVAAKAAIRDAAKRMSEKLIVTMLKPRQPGSAKIKIVLAGADFDLKLQFEELLNSIPDTITAVEEISFLDSRAEMEAVTSATGAQVAKAIFLAAKKLGMKLKVVEQSSGRCVFEIAQGGDSGPP